MGFLFALVFLLFSFQYVCSGDLVFGNSCIYVNENATSVSSPLHLLQCFGSFFPLFLKIGVFGSHWVVINIAKHFRTI